MSYAARLFELRDSARTFLVGERSVSYEQAAKEVMEMSSSVAAGETVVHFATNSVQSVLHYLALQWAGARVVAVDPLTSAEDLKFILEDSSPFLIIASEDVMNREKEVLKGYRVVTSLGRGSGNNEPYTYHKNEVGLIYYYAGIAGRTMQVLHSGESSYLNARALAKSTGLNEVRTALLVPLAHVLGNSVLGVTLALGGSLLIIPKFEPWKLASSIQEFRLNYLSAVPQVFEALLEVNGDLSSLSLCVSSAAPLRMEVQRRFLSKFGRVITQQYGFTEGMVLTFLKPELWETGAVGSPLEDVRLKVKDGELMVRAPWLMLGYSDEEETKKVWEEGWLKTGDLVKVIDDLVYFTGVKKRMLKFKGYPIFPKDLEAILRRHPAVSEVRVVGEEVEGLGQQPVALVVAKERRAGLEEELLNFVNSRVAIYKRVKRVQLVDSIGPE